MPLLMSFFATALRGMARDGLERVITGNLKRCVPPLCMTNRQRVRAASELVGVDAFLCRVFAKVQAVSTDFSGETILSGQGAKRAVPLTQA